MRSLNDAGAAVLSQEDSMRENEPSPEIITGNSTDAGCSHAGNDTIGRADKIREPWRWRCPNGHTSWRRAADGYHCGTGMRHDYSCAHFDDLVDAKENQS